MSTVTKAHLIQHLYDVMGINKREAKEVVSLFFDTISASLIQQESVKLSGLGTFKSREKAPRATRNPKTGEPVMIPRRRVVTFKTALSLKMKIQSDA
jgi:integration host factor subunit alpha